MRQFLCINQTCVQCIRIYVRTFIIKSHSWPWKSKQFIEVMPSICVLNWMLNKKTQSERLPNGTINKRVNSVRCKVVYFRDMSNTSALPLLSIMHTEKWDKNIHCSTSWARKCRSNTQRSFNWNRKTWNRQHGITLKSRNQSQKAER